MQRQRNVLTQEEYHAYLRGTMMWPQIRSGVNLFFLAQFLQRKEVNLAKVALYRRL